MADPEAQAVWQVAAYLRFRVTEVMEMSMPEFLGWLAHIKNENKIDG